MNQTQLQQKIEEALRTALGDLTLQLIVARATQAALEEENKHLKAKLSKTTVGSEAEEKGKGEEP